MFVSASEGRCTLWRGYSNIKARFDKDLILQKAYLQKGSQKIALEGAYQFSKAPIDMEYNPYTAKRGYSQFLTQPKIEDLSEPAFLDLN